MVDCGIKLKICMRESQKGGCWLWPALLQMDKCTGQLDQPFVERAIGFAPLGQPERLEYFMRFVKELLIKAFEKIDV